MADAIECSCAVIVCVSKEYKSSANCRMEANYANQRKKKGKLELFFVMMQQEYTTVSSPDSVDGYLGIMVGDNLWYPLWDGTFLSDTVDSITKLLGDHGKVVVGADVSDEPFSLSVDEEVPPTTTVESMDGEAPHNASGGSMTQDLKEFQAQIDIKFSTLSAKIDDMRLELKMLSGEGLEKPNSQKRSWVRRWMGR